MRRVPRSALTLVEVILVLALLVVIGAVTVPVLNGAILQARLRHSGDLLRSAFSKARLSAMQTGEPYVFRFEPGGPRYQISQLASLTATDAEEANMLPPDDGEDIEYSDADILRLSRSRLPEGVMFESGQVSAVPQMAAAATGGDWSDPVVFYADGTSSDAVVMLTNEDGLTLRVTLRGLTGSSHASDVGAGVTTP